MASPPLDPVVQDVWIWDTMRLSLAKSTARIDTMQEACSHTSFPSLPVEIRSKIFELVVGIPFPLSTNDFELLCTGANCGIVIDRKRSETKQAVADSCFPAFHTSRSFRLDALAAFVRVNTWDVQTSLLLIPRSWPTPMTQSCLSIESLTRIRNFYSRVDLCSAGFDILRPDSIQLPPDLDRSDKLACRRWIHSSRNDDEEKQTESDLCSERLARLDSFVTAITEAPDTPRTLVFDIVVHRGTPLRHKNLDQCGLTLKIEIKFLTGVAQNSATQPLETSDALRIFQQNFAEPLEHRRRLLAPLIRLRNVQRFTVTRSWTFKYERTSVIEGKEDPVGPIFMTETVSKTVSMGHHMQYRTAMALLEAVGKDFCNFTTTGLRQMGIPAHQVVEFEENTPWNDKTILVPPAPPGYFGKQGASF